MAEFPGLDRNKLEGFATFASENPKEVILDLEAKTIWEGSGLEHLGKVGPWSLAGKRIDKPGRDYSIQLGAWKEVEDSIGVPGATDRVEAMEAALVGLASYVQTAICLISAREGIKFDDLEVTAKVKVDPRLIFGIVKPDAAQDCLQSIDVDVKVAGDLSDAQRQRILMMADHSPVHLMVKQPNTINTRLV